MGNILVCKNSQAIIIAQNGKKLVVNKSHVLFEELNKMSKEEIIKWYENRK